MNKLALYVAGGILGGFMGYVLYTVGMIG